MKRFLALTITTFILSFLSFGNGLIHMTNHMSIRIFRLHRREYLVATARVTKVFGLSGVIRQLVRTKTSYAATVGSLGHNLSFFSTFRLPLMKVSQIWCTTIFNLHSLATEPPLLPPPKTLA